MAAIPGTCICRVVYVLGKAGDGVTDKEEHVCWFVVHLSIWGVQHARTTAPSAGNCWCNRSLRHIYQVRLSVPVGTCDYVPCIELGRSSATQFKKIDRHGTMWRCPAGSIPNDAHNSRRPCSSRLAGADCLIVAMTEPTEPDLWSCVTYSYSIVCCQRWQRPIQLFVRSILTRVHLLSSFGSAAT
jgi:hypothetical protein